MSNAQQGGQDNHQNGHQNGQPHQSGMEDCTKELMSLTDAEMAKATESHAHASGSGFQERRARRRAVISAPVRVRSVDVTRGGPDVSTTTLDISRNGLLVLVENSSFYRGMDVAVTFPYTRVKGVRQAEQHGRVVRLNELSAGRYSVAIALNAGAGEEIVRAQAKMTDARSNRGWQKPEADSKKPLVLAVDADPGIRMSLKTNLQSEGYDVIAVSCADEAHDVMNLLTPSLVIAEIEGADLPGYELCAHIKGTPRLQPIPVVLTTSSAYPTDYANAHSLGAVVCMAKPFRQERLSHVVRLLAPTPQAKMQTAPALRPNPARRAAAPCSTKPEKAKAKGFRFRSPW